MKKKTVVSAVIACALAIGGVGLSGCASCSRSMKTISSDMSGGMDRTVTVYDNNGDKLQEWSGKIDCTVGDSGRVMFDMDGKRVSIIGGTTIITEN